MSKQSVQDLHRQWQAHCAASAVACHESQKAGDGADIKASAELDAAYRTAREAAQVPSTTNYEAQQKVEILEWVLDCGGANPRDWRLLTASLRADLEEGFGGDDTPAAEPEGGNRERSLYSQAETPLLMLDNAVHALRVMVLNLEHEGQEADSSALYFITEGIAGQLADLGRALDASGDDPEPTEASD